MEMLLGDARWFSFVPNSASADASRHDQILQLLEDRGELSTEQIGVEVGLAPRTVRQEMSKIASMDKRVSSPKKGVWRWQETTTVESDLTH